MEKKEENLPFFGNTKTNLSHVLTISAISLMKLRISSTHSMKYIWYSPKKFKVNILYICQGSMKRIINKQCRLISEAAICGEGSGYTLFE